MAKKTTQKTTKQLMEEYDENIKAINQKFDYLGVTMDSKAQYTKKQLKQIQHGQTEIKELAQSTAMKQAYQKEWLTLQNQSFQKIDKKLTKIEENTNDQGKLLAIFDFGFALVTITMAVMLFSLASSAAVFIGYILTILGLLVFVWTILVFVGVNSQKRIVSEKTIKKITYTQISLTLSALIVYLAIIGVEIYG